MLNDNHEIHVLSYTFEAGDEQI